MAEDLTRNRMAVEANSRIADRANAGIAWGTNSRPAHSPIGWFGSPTSGVTARWQPDSFNAGDTSALNATFVLRYVANMFTAIRRARIIIRYHDFGFVTTLTDQTAMASTSVAAGNFNAHNFPSVRAGADMSLTAFRNDLDAMWNLYVNTMRNSTVTLSHDVCHTNCHSNCHDSRTRR